MRPRLLTHEQSEEESDAEKQEVKKEEDQKETPDQKTGNGPKTAPTGSNTGKPKSVSDTKKVNSLKRPGSPNLSEMESSGNESSRKRVKKNATGSVQNSRASTPVPGAQNGLQRPKKAVGATSDGEATGAEMSDAGRKKFTKKIKLVSGSHGKGTPTGSRAGSPVPGASQLPSGKIHDSYAMSFRTNSISQQVLNHQAMVVLRLLSRLRPQPLLQRRRLLLL